jgi:hypothetical protein
VVEFFPNVKDKVLSSTEWAIQEISTRTLGVKEDVFIPSNS